jgi:PAB1-binding protein PBP1
LNGDELRNLSLQDVDDGKQFNQFEGKKSTYHDNIYTTAIDENRLTDELRRKARILEREILGQESGGNVHLAEDRNQLDQ